MSATKGTIVAAQSPSLGSDSAVAANAAIIAGKLLALSCASTRRSTQSLLRETHVSLAPNTSRARRRQVQDCSFFVVHQYTLIVATQLVARPGARPVGKGDIDAVELDGEPNVVVVTEYPSVEMLLGTAITVAMLLAAVWHFRHFRKAGTAMTPQHAYRARLRFRLQKKLNIAAREHKFAIKGREVVLTPALPDIDIGDSEWLVLNTRGFATEDDARNFGHRLRAALEVSSVSTRLGVDAGRDLATSGLSDTFRRELQRQTGNILRDNIHGLDVFVDDPNTRIFNFSAAGTVRANPVPFLADLDGLFDVAVNTSARARDVILLLNTALVQAHPVAQMMFAFSAVEMLGQQRTWTDDQKPLLASLATAAEASTFGTADERSEVADAIRNTHRLTLRQGVMRLLDDLDLGHLKKPWDAIYKERSKLVHGLAPEPGVDYSDLAHRSVSLCGRILLKVVASDIPAAERYVDQFYERH